MNKVIEVLCYVFPDGTTHWARRSEHALFGGMRAWKAALPEKRRKEYEEAGVRGGFVVVRMLESDYEEIPATNLSYAISEASAA